VNIITDTNIWYSLGRDNALLEKVRGLPITPSFVNLRELTKTGAMVEREESVRAAIQAMLQFRGRFILEPPFIHLAKLCKEFLFDGEKACEHEFAIAEIFAAGGQIAPEHMHDFQAILDEKNEVFQGSADLFNIKAELIRSTKTKGENKADDSIDYTADFINFCVAKSTDGRVDLEGCQLVNFELLLVTLDHFFNKMETSPMKFKGNDWYDFTQLAYVQPSDKFWTLEQRWLTMINDAGMGDYLFSPDSMTTDTA
jgi:hypothetical protein